MFYWCSQVQQPLLSITNSSTIQFLGVLAKLNCHQCCSIMTVIFCRVSFFLDGGVIIRVALSKKNMPIVHAWDSNYLGADF